MQARSNMLSTPMVGGWLTDALNLAKKVIPGAGGPATINVNAGTPASAATPVWVMPALLGGGALLVFAILKRK